MGKRNSIKCRVLVKNPDVYFVGFSGASGFICWKYTSPRKDFFVRLRKAAKV